MPLFGSFMTTSIKTTSAATIAATTTKGQSYTVPYEGYVHVLNMYVVFELFFFAVARDHSRE